MDALQLEYFLAIVDHDGFGRAAQHLHIAQPSLSQSIAIWSASSASRCSTGSAAASSSAPPVAS